MALNAFLRAMESPFLRATGQAWKGRLGWALVALGGVEIFASQHSCLGGLEAAELQLTLGATVLSMGALFWMIRSIRCPRCRAKLFWHAANTRGGLDWFQTFDTCPKCHYAPERFDAVASVEPK